MIKARHSKFYEGTLGSFIDIMMATHFGKINVYNNFSDNKLPVLLLGNHASWWDGFFARWLNKKIFKRKLFVMMLEQELTKRKFLSRLGAFSINRKSRSMVETFRYAEALLKNPDNVLAIFPQGKLQSSYQKPIKFEKGWFRLIEKSDTPFHIVFFVSLTDYGNKPRPEINHYLEEFYPPQNSKPSHVESAFNDFLDRCIAHQIQKI